MTTTVFPIHRAVGRPIHFKGLKAQYILYAALALVANLLVFVILYCCRVPPWFCISLAFIIGGSALTLAMKLSKKFGAHGLMKFYARKHLPQHARSDSARAFFDLQNVQLCPDPSN